MSRSTTPRRVQITKKPTVEDDIIHSDTESISTAIDAVDDDDNVLSNEHITESAVDNMFANLVMNNEPLVKPAVKKKSPRTTTKKSSSPVTKFHYKSQTISDITDEDNTKVEEIPEETSVVQYSEDFSLVPTETSTPRPFLVTPIQKEKPPQ